MEYKHSREARGPSNDLRFSGIGQQERDSASVYQQNWTHGGLLDVLLSLKLDLIYS